MIPSSFYSRLGALSNYFAASYTLMHKFKANIPIPPARPLMADLPVNKIIQKPLDTVVQSMPVVKVDPNFTASPIKPANPIPYRPPLAKTNEVESVSQQEKAGGTAPVLYAYDPRGDVILKLKQPTPELAGGPMPFTEAPEILGPPKPFVTPGVSIDLPMPEPTTYTPGKIDLFA